MKQIRKRILISDCDTEVLIALERMLEDAGFDTTLACTEAETDRLLSQQKFDLALVADHPPELNCERLLRQARSGGVPVVALENRPRHPFSEPYLLSLGAEKIVHKWEHQEVHDAVNELLVRQRAGIGKSGVAAAAKLG